MQLFADASEENAANENEASDDIPSENENGNEADETAAGETEAQSTDDGIKNEKLMTLRSLEDTFMQFRRASDIENTVNRWEKEAEELKETYPGFELKKELDNADFAALLTAGVPVRRAYEAVNLDAIMASAMRYAALTAGKKAAEELARQNARPQENSVLDRASSVRKTDVNSLTEKDIMRILSQVSKGAKISFK